MSTSLPLPPSSSSSSPSAPPPTASFSPMLANKRKLLYTVPPTPEWSDESVIKAPDSRSEKKKKGDAFSSTLRMYSPMPSTGHAVIESCNADKDLFRILPGDTIRILSSSGHAGKTFYPLGTLSHGIYQLGTEWTSALLYTLASDPKQEIKCADRIVEVKPGLFSKDKSSRRIRKPNRAHYNAFVAADTAMLNRIAPLTTLTLSELTAPAATGEQKYTTLSNMHKLRIGDIDEADLTFNESKGSVKDKNVQSNEVASNVGKFVTRATVTSYIGGGGGKSLTFSVGDRVWFIERLSKHVPGYARVSTVVIASMVYFDKHCAKKAGNDGVTDPISAVAQHIKVYAQDREQSLPIWELLPQPATTLSGGEAGGNVAASTSAAGSSSAGLLPNAAAPSTSPTPALTAHRPGLRKLDATTSANTATSSTAAAATSSLENIANTTASAAGSSKRSKAQGSGKAESTSKTQASSKKRPAPADAPDDKATGASKSQKRGSTSTRKR